MTTDTGRAPALESAAAEGHTLDPDRMRVRRGPLGEFRCELDGDRCYLNCRASRCFPLSDRERYIALFDGLKGEIGVLGDLRKLDETSRKLIVEMLERRYFIPVIEHIRSIHEEFGVVYWSAETSAGPRDFVCRGMRDSVQTLSEVRLLVTDADGNRFEIPDYTTLSRSVQAVLDRVL